MYYECQKFEIIKFLIVEFTEYNKLQKSKQL